MDSVHAAADRDQRRTLLKVMMGLGVEVVAKLNH